MAKVTVPQENRTIEQRDEVAEFLAAHKIAYSHWGLDRLVGDDATDSEILAAYSPEIDQLKLIGKFVTADVIGVTPDTPNLDVMLAKFSKEHTHAEDEVRFIVKGRGTFHIHTAETTSNSDGEVFAIEMEAGDWISVPAGTRHWFDLCTERTIRAIRLFKDTSGWTPNYVENSILHETYAPVCWGPRYVTSGGIRLKANIPWLQHDSNERT